MSMYAYIIVNDLMCIDDRAAARVSKWECTFTKCVYKLNVYILELYTHITELLIHKGPILHT